MSSRIRLLGAVLLLASGLAGCGDRFVPVTGTVQVDSTPVEKGTITFIPVDGKSPDRGGEIVNGAYNVRASVGAMRVKISMPVDTGVRKKLYDAKESKEIPLMKEGLPEKYSGFDSELRFDVPLGGATKDWSLSTK
jgi:hypothetical protein